MLRCFLPAEDSSRTSTLLRRGITDIIAPLEGETMQLTAYSTDSSSVSNRTCKFGEGLYGVCTVFLNGRRRDRVTLAVCVCDYPRVRSSVRTASKYRLKTLPSCNSCATPLITSRLQFVTSHVDPSNGKARTLV